MTRMTGPDCAVMCNLIHTHTHTHATYSLLPLAMPTCGEVGSDVHALIKELVIRRVEHRSETHSNESQHLAEGTEIARLGRRFSFVLRLTIFLPWHVSLLDSVSASRNERSRPKEASIQTHCTSRVLSTTRLPGELFLYCTHKKSGCCADQFQERCNLTAGYAN